MCAIMRIIIFLLSLSLPSLLHASPTTTKVCPLYEPPAPGINCLQSDQVTDTITNSRWVWVLEMYSSWCGHCQRFAPHMKELAADLEAWSDFVRIGVIECTDQKNRDFCSKTGIKGFPTTRMFRPRDPKPLDNFKEEVGAQKSAEQLRHWIVDHVASLTPRPEGWPSFNINWTSDDMFQDAASWIPSVFVFESAGSYLSKELMLDFLKVDSVRIRSVLDSESALVRHYSVLEFPSIVVEMKRGLFHLIPGHSVKDARSEFRYKIVAYLSQQGVKLPGRLLQLLHKAPPPDSAPHHHELGHTAHPLAGTRVELTDLLGAISYALRAEVPVQSIISGPAYSTLYNFMTLLEQAFSADVAPLAVHSSLLAVRQKLERQNQAGFITNKEWNRIVDSKLDPSVFPTDITWKSCNGSRPHFRGYPCGLWSLMHATSLLTLPVNHAPHTLQGLSGAHNTTSTHNEVHITSTTALTIMANFVQHFFSCQVCRTHFSEMARSLPQTSLEECGDAILWLWEAHNKVNARLLSEGGGDPSHPKTLFPSVSRCPYCYQKSGSGMGWGLLPGFNNTGFLSGESQVGGVVGSEGMVRTTAKEPRSVLRARQLKSIPGEYVWNRTAVLLYLWNFYHLEPKYGNGTKTGLKPVSRVPPYAIVQAAWPKKFGVGFEDFYQRYLESRRQLEGSYDPGVCLTWFVICAVFLALLVFWFQRKRRWRNRFRF